MVVFVRGADTGIEYKRDDHSFFRGIVVKNWDPRKLYRIKIYIPEVSNQPLEDWLQAYKNLDFRFPGTNNEQDVWSDVDIFEKIAEFLPYAEPCFPLIGENSPARYQCPTGTAVITDSDYEDGFTTNDEDPPTIEKGSFGPSFWQENFSTNMGDSFRSPTGGSGSGGNYTAKNNPYSFQFRPSNQVNKPKGVFSVPSVGSQVWVFHYRGDLNFPVYIGGRHDFRGNCLITDSDASQTQEAGGEGVQAPFGPEGPQSLDYPGVFENFKTETSPGYE
jgi:hypothetical protein|tara:strand:- start:609 stop:1433 length:825 start_codon:yes stop_codon:yes gene_type:complete